MTRMASRCTLPLLAVLATACDDECSYDSSGLFGDSAPPPYLMGTWEGREAPFTTKDTYPWWRFELQDGGRNGTFATDRPVHQGNHPLADTLRGTFSGVVCLPKDEIEWVLELDYGSYAEPCTFTGKVSGEFRIDGVLGCTIDDTSTYWKALYLVNEPL